MLILDDLLLAPFKGLLWTFKKIQRAAEDEMDAQRTRTRAELSDLYMQLETGKITEEEFDTREKALLDKLDKLKPKPPPAPPAEEGAEEAGGDEKPPESSGS